MLVTSDSAPGTIRQCYGLKLLSWLIFYRTALLLFFKKLELNEVPTTFPAHWLLLGTCTNNFFFNFWTEIVT